MRPSLSAEAYMLRNADLVRPNSGQALHISSVLPSVDWFHEMQELGATQALHAFSVKGARSAPFEEDDYPKRSRLW